MLAEVSTYVQKFSSIFEPDLLAQLEAQSMLMQVKGGETMLNIGQSIRAVPILISGTFKVSRVRMSLSFLQSMMKKQRKNFRRVGKQSNLTSVSYRNLAPCIRKFNL